MRTWFHFQFQGLSAEGAPYALTLVTRLFFLRCLPENSEIWDIPWKLCSPGVSGLRVNLEPTRTGWGKL